MSLATSIDDFFAAAFDPARWPSTLDGLARAVGAEGATLVFDHSAVARRGTIAGSASLLDDLRDYFDRDIPDPRQDRVRPTLADGVVTDFDHFSPEEIAREPYYQEFLRPRGYGWHAVALLREGAVTATLSLKRKLHQGAFQASEVRLLNRVVPHLRRVGAAAAAVHGAMMQDQLAAYAAAGLGAITLDRAGRCIGHNALVAFGDGLELGAGRPRASHRGDRAALDAAIARALHPERPGMQPPLPVVPLRRPSGLRPLVVEVLPVIGQPGLSLLNVAALLLVTDLGRPSPPAVATLRAVFDLTAREAELAAHLAVGLGLREAAAQLSISFEHARQRLKSIFRKTGTHRQAELVVVLARVQSLQRPG